MSNLSLEEKKDLQKKAKKAKKTLRAVQALTEFLDNSVSVATLHRGIFIPKNNPDYLYM